MDSIAKVQAAIDALVQASIDPEVEELLDEADERMLNVTIGALVEYRDALQDRVAV